MLRAKYDTGSFAVCGIGVDIEYIPRFKKILKNNNFLKRVFTDKEIKYCRRFNSPEIHLAARFAGKEAVFKAFAGNKALTRKLGFKDIEILNRKDGAPFVNIKGKMLKKRYAFFVSLSHSNTKAVAFSVIGEKV